MNISAELSSIGKFGRTIGRLEYRSMSKTQYQISIAEEFARVPGGRYEWQGKKSGEEFLKTLLRPKFIEALAQGAGLAINFDGGEGYSSAFIDGSFGELAREFGSDKLIASLTFISYDEPLLIDEVLKHIKSAVK